MLQSRKRRELLAQILKQLICIGMVLIVITPILLTFFASLKTKGDIWMRITWSGCALFFGI